MNPCIAANAGVIHDIRNLMTVIVSSSFVLANTDCKDQSLLAAGICTAAENLGPLIDLLDSSRVTRKACGTSDVNTVMQHVACLLRPVHPEVVIQVLPNPTKTRLQINQGELFRCVMNLTDNAVESARENTGVKPIVTLEVLNQPSVVRIRVSDSGRGFSQPLEQAATPFQSDRVVPDRHEGLGLFVVQSIVKSYRGRLDMTRENSKTIVSIDFPNAGQPVDEPATDAAR